MELEHLLAEETEAIRIQQDFCAHLVHDWARQQNEAHRYALTKRNPPQAAVILNPGG